MKLPRLPAGRLGDDDALILLRQLGVVFIGLNLALGIGGAEEVVLICRIAGGLCAVLIVAAVLAQRARADAAGPSALVTLPTAAVGLTLLLWLLDVGSQNKIGALAWPIVGGLAGGTAIAARVGSVVGLRAVQRSGDAYALYVHRRRSNPLASMAPLARPMLAIGVGGVVAYLGFNALFELDESRPWAANGLMASVFVLIAPLTAAAVLMAMPLFGDDAGRGDRAAPLRRAWTRSSGVQPLPDMIGSAIASIVTIASGRSRTPGLDASAAAPQAPDAPRRAPPRG